MADSPPRRKPRLEAGAEGEAATEVAPDLLSPLPLEILDKILSRLHIYDVVRTSVLSRAWRRRWETLPTVNLFGKHIPADEVDSLLLRRTAPLRTFRLVGYMNWYVDAVHDWLLYLSRNGVETLILWFPPVGFRLHSSLFSCRELTSLDLTNCRLPPAPAGFAGFPSLKTLRFNKVAIPEHGGKQLAALIARSPSIETLGLTKVELIGDDPEAEDEWVIRAPNLRELTIAGPFPYGGRVEDLPRLQKGVLFGCNYAKFLMGMAHVTELEFACGLDWSAEVDVLDRLPFLFENLRSLVIAVDFTEMFVILSFFCLLRSAPVLEELILCGLSDGSQVINADEKFLNAQWVDGMFAKLHVVRMKNILCLSNEMHFVEFILSKARILQVLSVRLGPDALCSHEEVVITIKEYPKASPNAQVIFLGSESTNTGPINTSTENAKVGEVQTTGREHDTIEIPAEDAEMEETQTEDHKRGSIPTSTENDEAEEIQTTGREHDSIDTPAENVEMEDAQIEDGKCGSISTSTENDEAGEIQTIGRKHDCMDTPAENVEMEQTQRGDGKCGSISTSAENDEAGEIQTTTGRKHDCTDTPAENVEMEQTQTGDGKCGSISTSTENGDVGGTQTTTGSGCESIDTSFENAEMDEAQTTGSEDESINTSTENAEVEERQTACSGQVNDVHPRRRHRLDLESVAQLEQMEVDIQKLQEDMRLNLDSRRLELENRTLLLNSRIDNLKYGPCFKELSEHTNISLPPFPEPSSVLSSLLVTSRAGGSPANLGVNGAASVHMDSSEDVGLNSADNAQPDPHEDATINVAIMAPGDSSGHA